MKLICTCLLSILIFSCNKKPQGKTVINNKEVSVVELPNIITSAVITSGIMDRDSGKLITADFLQRCVKESTKSYFEFYCNDLLWSYYILVIKNKLIYLIENGTSVENRILFSLANGTITKIDDPLPKMLTYSKVSKLLNKKYPGSNYTEEKLKKSAHSHYRTKLPRNPQENIVILSGELGNNHGYKPIAEVKWDGKTFKLIE